MRLILAEDDSDLRALISVALAGHGYEVIECADGAELLLQIEPLLSGDGLEVHAVITDIRMPGVTGLSVLGGIHELAAELPVIVITAFGSPETHARAMELGAARVIDKPFDIDELVSVVSQVTAP